MKNALEIIKGRSILENIMLLGIVISIATVIYSVLTYGISHITSDVATSYLLSKCIVDHGSLLPETWNSANGEIWFFSGEMMAFPFNILMDNKPLARMLGSIITIVITIVGVCYSTKRLFKSNAGLLIIPIFLIFLGNSQARDNNLYQVAYTFRMMWIILCPALLYEQLREDSTSKRKKISTIILCIILTGMMVRGTRYLAEQTLPLLLTVFIFFYLKNVEKDTSWKDTIICGAKSIVTILVPSVLGFGFYKYLSLSRNLNESSELNGLIFVGSLTDIYSNIMATINNAFSCFGYAGDVSFISIDGLCNIITLVMGLLICIVIPILQIKEIKEENAEVKFYTIYAIFHNVIMLIIIILDGKLRLAWLLSTVFVNIIVSGRYIYEKWIQKGNYRYLLSGLFLIAILIESLSLIKYSGDWKSEYTSERNLANQIKEYGLTKGYASFWNAYSTEVYSDGDVEFAEILIENNGNNRARYWLVDSDRYVAKDQKTFLMLSEAENEEQAGYIVANFGEPIDMFVVNDVYAYNEYNAGNGYAYTNMYIYVFDYDIASKANNGCYDGKLEAHELTFNYVGEIADDGTYVLYNGGILQGPYSAINKGKYTLTIEGRGLESATIEIIDAGDPQTGEFEYECIETTDECLKYKVMVYSKVDTIDFRIINNSETNIEVKNILIESN